MTFDTVKKFYKIGTGAGIGCIAGYALYKNMDKTDEIHEELTNKKTSAIKDLGNGFCGILLASAVTGLFMMAYNK